MRHGQDPSRDQLHLLGKPSAGTGVTSPLLGRMEVREGAWKLVHDDGDVQGMPVVVQDTSLTLNT